MKFRAFIISAILLATLAIGAGRALAVSGLPPFPSDYRGTVYVGGVNASAGLVVTAGINDWRTPEGAVTDASGNYWLGIAPNDSKYINKVIHFYVNGVQAKETATFTEDKSVTDFDLNVSAVPTPTATPKASPTPTTTPISSHGNSIIGASGGTVSTTDGNIRIEFPAGAFNASTNVSIQSGACHPGNAGFVVGSTCFNVTPSGELGAPARICVNLSAYDFSIVNKSDLKLGYWFNGSWNLAGNITLAGTTLCGNTTHLSDWAVLGSTAPISSHVNGSVGASGGTVSTTDGNIWIEFPAGAFNASTNVSIQGGACHPGNNDFMVGSTCFNVTPDGDLGAPARICVNLSAYDFSIVNNKADLKLGYWSNGSWNLAGNITLAGTILCGNTTHLSDWAVLGSTVNGTPVPTPVASASPTTTATPATTEQPASTPIPTHTPSQTDEGGTNWALVGGIAGGLLLLAAIVIAMNSRRRGKRRTKGKGKRKPKQRPSDSKKAEKKEEPWDF